MDEDRNNNTRPKIYVFILLGVTIRLFLDEMALFDFNVADLHKGNLSISPRIGPISDLEGNALDVRCHLLSSMTDVLNDTATASDGLSQLAVVEIMLKFNGTCAVGDIIIIETTEGVLSCKCLKKKYSPVHLSMPVPILCLAVTLSWYKLMLMWGAYVDMASTTESDSRLEQILVKIC